MNCPPVLPAIVPGQALKILNINPAGCTYETRLANPQPRYPESYSQPTILRYQVESLPARRLHTQLRDLLWGV